MTVVNDPKTEITQEKLKLLPQGNYLLSCMTTLRSSDSDVAAFAAAFDSVASQLIAAALDMVPADPVETTTPTGRVYGGCKLSPDICGVSILRAGASFEGALRRAYGIRVSFGMILIQRDESTALPVLEDAGVRQDSIIFVNLVASRHGISTLQSRFPRLKMVTAAIDDELTESRHIAPGLGDFGDRFYGTI
ncbi:uracil phosphoribosyltransferase [Geosmithia morbida]|uniref:Uracil phosphoribosyltransferase n=1 Tax=Geosmithia morbida TaxID=1094350 RepID=A0A9P5D3E7_9HYPO|nr:uracil phosphoribosyltransferase [Geosmithia morbida]KAF4126093.1 uracil phosphoribosyltransferase [Geosmithia morbida]